jgi:hypothetical protein
MRRAAGGAGVRQWAAPVAEELPMAEADLPKDFFEFMQKMWTPMNFPMPGMGMPTVDIGEIQNKIAELKAVETWLTMNVGFVQMTIKTLEMQKAALESLQAGAQPPSGGKPPG